MKNRDFVTASLRNAQQLTRWDFTGFSRENTGAGRLAGTLASGPDGYTVRVYRKALMDAADLVASGTTASAASTIALNPVGGSGLSGSAWLDYVAPEDAMDLRVFYSCDDDLDDYERSLSDLLDASGNYDGAPGFERFHKQAKRIIDDTLRVRLAGQLPAGADNRPSPSALVWDDSLSEASALLALSLLFRHLSQGPGDDAHARALDYLARAHRALENARPAQPGQSPRALSTRPINRR